MPDVEEIVTKNKHDPVNEFFKKKSAVGRSDSTLEKYSRILHNFFHSYFPGLEPGEVQVKHIEEFIIELEADFHSENSPNGSMSNKTKRVYLNALSSFYNWAVKRPRFDDITGNPAAVVLEEIPKETRQRPDVATWENAKKIVRTIHDPRNKLLAAFLAKTGVRIQEALTIQKTDLLLDDGFIRLRDRKGGKETLLPVDQELIQLFRRHEYTCRFPDHEYIFVSRHRNRLSYGQARRIIKDAATQAGVVAEDAESFEKRFTPHTFRTVFTTQMRRQDMPDHILKYIRGDSDQDMLDHYTRIDPEEARKEYLDCIQKINI